MAYYRVANVEAYKCGRYAEGLRKQSIKPHLKPIKVEVRRKVCGKYAIAIGAEERRKFRGRSAEAKKSMFIHHRGGSKAEGMRKIRGSKS